MDLAKAYAIRAQREKEERRLRREMKEKGKNNGSPPPGKPNK